MKILSKYYWVAFLSLSLILSSGCLRNDDPEIRIMRFEQEIFEQANEQTDSIIRHLDEANPDFMRIFCEHIIAIGEVSDPNLGTYLRQFTSDPVIREVYELSQKAFPDFKQQAYTMTHAINKFNELTDAESLKTITTYLSGFNQSFVTLDQQIAIGLDNYLGADCPFYKQLRLPDYLIAWRTPEQVVPDAVRAWITSEIPEQGWTNSLLGRMIYEGIIYYATLEVMPKDYHQQIFRYQQKDWEWCEQNEKAVWTYLIEHDLLFSSDQFMISRMTGDAPFTRDFGNDSPPRIAGWTGYRIVAAWMKKNRATLAQLTAVSDPETFLAESAYRP